jgi:hypothetical protein
MRGKKLGETRGGQSRIFRLASFDLEAFIHMLFYRILIFVAPAYGVLTLVSLLYPFPPFVLKALTVLLWVLFTPQLFETVKALSLSWSRGMSFGHLNEEYSSLVKERYGGGVKIYSSLPFLVLLLWSVGFVFMVVWLY